MDLLEKMIQHSEISNRKRRVDHTSTFFLEEKEPNPSTGSVGGNSSSSSFVISSILNQINSPKGKTY